MTAQASLSVKNLPLYELIRSAFPGFGWALRGTQRPGDRIQVVVDWENYPEPQRGFPPPLLKLAEYAEASLRGEEVPIMVPENSREALFNRRGLLHLARVSDEGVKLANLLASQSLSFSFGIPLAAWFRDALVRREATVVALVCPDYSTKTEGGKEFYTFGGLGDGVGLVARRAVPLLAPLHKLLSGMGIKTVFRVFLGDEEADNPTNLVSAGGITKEVFIARLRKSAEAFQARATSPEGLEVSARLLTEEDRPYWEECVARAREAILRKDYGPGVTRGRLAEIRAGRAALYRQWYGPEADTLKLLLEQAVEYMAFGPYLDRIVGPHLRLAADHPSMNLFSHWGSVTGRPTGCLPRAY